MANVIGGAQGNTGTVIIGKNPIIDNPLDPWWDIQGAVNSGANTVNQASHAANTVKKAATDTSTGVTSVAKAVTYVVKNAKYAAIWTGLMILAIALVLMGLSRNGVRPPAPPIVVAP